MNELTCRAPAKINLTLRIGDVRPDGYHELESLVALIGLEDLVTVRSRQDESITIECEDPSVPRDESNLAVRAAQELAHAAGQPCGADIRLEKRIPPGAGLGGGSSDAASTLIALNQLWRLERSAAQLAEIGARIGSDVPLFFTSRLSVMRGRGEQVQPAPGEWLSRLPTWCALVLPELSSPTGPVYAAFDRRASVTSRPSPEALFAESDPSAGFFNDLLPAACEVTPALKWLHDGLHRAAAAGPWHMTGSGSAFFRLCRDEAEARSLAARVRQALGPRTEAVKLGVPSALERGDSEESQR